MPNIRSVIANIFLGSAGVRGNELCSRVPVANHLNDDNGQSHRGQGGGHNTLDQIIVSHFPPVLVTHPTATAGVVSCPLYGCESQPATELS